MALAPAYIMPRLKKMAVGTIRTRASRKVPAHDANALLSAPNRRPIEQDKDSAVEIDEAGLSESNRKSGIRSIRTGVGFNPLPPEILQEIAAYLPDKDLGAFALVQQVTRDAVIPANAGHWRQRFIAQFDLPSGKTPLTIKAAYTLRKRALTPLVHFKYGQSPDEEACLDAIRQLIVERSQGPGDLVPHELDRALSLNVRQLWRFMKTSNLLHDAFRWTRFREHRINPLLEAIQVYFFGWNIWCARYKLGAAYPESLRRTAYSIEISEGIALAGCRRKLVNAKGQINFEALSHLTNFWKFHMAINVDGDLRRILLQLPPEQCPMSFPGPYKQGLPRSRLGMKWQGALFGPTETEKYARSRHHITNEVSTTPYFTGGDRLLELWFAHAGAGDEWPEAFNKEVQARPSGLRRIRKFTDHPEQSRPIGKPANEASWAKFTKSMTSPQSGVEGYNTSLPWHHNYVSSADYTSRTLAPPTKPTKKIQETHFHGFGEINVHELPLNVAGIVHSLPSQHGIPGWQRFTMVAYETPATGSAEKGFLDANEADLCAYLRFEGVVLPGGSIVMGRYELGDEYRDDGDAGQFLQRGAFVYWLSRGEADDGGGGGEGEDGGEEEEEVEEGIEGEVEEDEELWLDALKTMHESG